MQHTNTAWLLGDLSALMQNIGKGRAEDQLGGLSSPQRQLYYLGGLLISSKPTGERDIQYTPIIWNKIVGLLNNIEQEYEKMFFPDSKQNVDEEWLKIRKVAVPSFLSYFNQGPLNYEEQTTNWIQELFTVCGAFIQNKITLRRVENSELIVTSPDLAFIFDKQYDKEMGFENEKLLKEKLSGNYSFW